MGHGCMGIGQRVDVMTQSEVVVVCVNKVGYVCVEERRMDKRRVSEDMGSVNAFICGVVKVFV